MMTQTTQASTQHQRHRSKPLTLFADWTGKKIDRRKLKNTPQSQTYPKMKIEWKSIRGQSQAK